MAYQVIWLTLASCAFVLLISPGQSKISMVDNNKVKAQLGCKTAGHILRVGETLSTQCQPFAVMLKNTANAPGPQVELSLQLNDNNGLITTLEDVNRQTIISGPIIASSGQMDQTIVTGLGNMMIPTSYQGCPTAAFLELMIITANGMKIKADRIKVLLQHCEDTGNVAVDITGVATTPPTVPLMYSADTGFSIDISSINVFESVSLKVSGGDLLSRNANNPHMLVYAIGYDHEFQKIHQCMQHRVKIGILVDIIGIDSFTNAVNDGTSRPSLINSSPLMLNRPRCGEQSLWVIYDPLASRDPTVDDVCDNSMMVKINIDCTNIEQEVINDFEKTILIPEPLHQGAGGFAMIAVKGEHADVMQFDAVGGWQTFNYGFDEYFNTEYARAALFAKRMASNTDICSEVNNQDLSLDLDATQIDQHNVLVQACKDALIDLAKYGNVDSLMYMNMSTDVHVKKVRTACAGNARVIRVFDVMKNISQAMMNNNTDIFLDPVMIGLYGGDYLVDGDYPESPQVFRAWYQESKAMREVMKFGRLIKHLVRHEEHIASDPDRESHCKPGGIQDPNICAHRALSHFMDTYSVAVLRDTRKKREEEIQGFQINDMWSWYTNSDGTNPLPPAPDCSNFMPDMLDVERKHPVYYRVREDDQFGCTIEQGERNPLIDTEDTTGHVCWKKIAVCGCPACSGYYNNDIMYDDYMTTTQAPNRKKRDVSAQQSNKSKRNTPVQESWKETLKRSVASAFGNVKQSLRGQQKRGVGKQTMAKNAATAGRFGEGNMRYKREKLGNLVEKMDDLKHMFEEYVMNS